MNLLMIVPKYEDTVKKCYYYTFHMGIGYIISYIKKAGYEIDCLNLNHCEGTIKKILTKQLDKKEYDFVMVGSNTIGYLIVKKIINICREHKSKPKTLVGGTLVTGEPKLVFEDIKIDYGVVDEGEETVVEILNCYKNNKSLDNVKGVLYRDEKGEIVYNGDREPIKDLNSIPFPDYQAMGFEEFLDNQNSNMCYIHSAFDFPRVYHMVGSRSCPFHCTFCWHYNHFVRFRSIDNIMQELEERIKKYKINRIYILDECFALDKKRLAEFCKKISKLKREIDWDLKWVTSMRVNLVDRELLKLLKESGCDTISYGFESYNREVLKSMKKGITPKQIDFAIKETMKAKITMQGNFIFGDIAETKETAYETLNYWINNCNGQIHLDFITPYPNSETYKYCIKKGIIKDKIQFFKDLCFSKCPTKNFSQMTDEELNKLEQDILKALAKYRKIITPISIKKSENKKYDLEIECPFCKKRIIYKNYLIENKFFYSSVIACRECKLRFYIASPFRKFLLDHYEKAKVLKGWELKLKAHMNNIRNYCRC